MLESTTSTLRRLSIDALPTFNILHTSEADAEAEEDDHDDDDDHLQSHQNHKDHGRKKDVPESLDFNDRESIMWRKYQYRRYYQTRGKFWTASRVTTFWKWTLVVVTGVLIGFAGAFASVFTEILTGWKLESCYKLMEAKNFAGAFFAYQFLSAFLVICGGILCWYQPFAAGSGIPEIKALLNGVNMSHVVRFPVLAVKLVAMCFSCASGLPLGKEGPMIHAGSIIGGLVSQGYTFSLSGYDSSWTIFQDLRNDANKRDYVTYGSAAGIAGAFRAPIGGILLALEEGSSFWSTNTTFRAFICAAITQLTMGLIFPKESTSSAEMFALGQFENLFDGRANYRVYELPIFLAIGCIGGCVGALFNFINGRVTLYRKKYLNAYKWKRMVEVVLITLTMSFISFILPMCWQRCTPMPQPTDSTTVQEKMLYQNLVHFQCDDSSYNQLASLYFNSDDMAMRQLFHFREVDGTGNNSFTTGPLILFFLPYCFMASITAGIIVPAGLFVPTLLSGAAMGRLFGHWLNLLFPSYVADSGTYALIGAASILGGMARMTIAGCVIMLEACGNITYLLPLMVTFAATRYVGNAIGEPMYDMQLRLKDMPFLEGSLHSIGLLNYHPLSQIMSQPVVTICEIEKVSRVMEILTTTKHNGFPVISKDGKLRGLILRKTLCGLLKLKAYSTPKGDSRTPDGGIILEQAATVFYDSLERVYPNYPDVSSIKMSDKEMQFWLDVRAHMDTAPIFVNVNTSIKRGYHIFRTMGLRHLLIIDGDMHVVGIITRADVDEHRLHHYWEEEREKMQKELNVEVLPPAVVYESKDADSQFDKNFQLSTEHDVFPYIEPDPEVVAAENVPSDSPNISLRKKMKH